MIEPGDSVVATIRAISDPLTVCGLCYFDIADLVTLTTPPCYGGSQVPHARRALLTIHTPPSLSIADMSNFCEVVTNAHPVVELLVATPISNALTISLIELADA